MLRFMFGRPRTVRVPIGKSSVEVRQVKVTRNTRSVATRFIWTCVITTAAVQGIKWDPLGTYAQRDVIQDELERVKKQTRHGHEDKYGKHWGEQHSRIRSSQTDAETFDTSKSDAIRLTIPVWLRKGHQRMYTENDTEWKEFAKLQGDKKRIEQIKRQIAESVLSQIKDYGRNKFELAVIKFNGKVAVALEVVPQVFTPPIHEVPCIWVSSKSLSTGWRPLPPQTGARMERVFRPVVLLEASTAAAKTFLYITYAVTKAKIMNALGREGPKAPKTTIVLPKLPPEEQDASDRALSSTSRSTKPVFPLFPDFGNGDAMRKMHAEVVSSMPYSSAIQHAAFTFDHVRNARQRLAVSTNVRGICQIRGYLTFFGDRGRFRLEVMAYYLPGDNVFVGAVSVKQGYVVQDYRAWEQTNAREKKVAKEKELKKQEATTVTAPSTSESPKPAGSPTVPPPGDVKEDDK